MELTIYYRWANVSNCDEWPLAWLIVRFDELLELCNSLKLLEVLSDPALYMLTYDYIIQSNTYRSE
jgi:hypothetical protein